VAENQEPERGQHTEETISSAVVLDGCIRHPFGGTSIVPFDAYGLGRPKAPAATRAIDGTFLVAVQKPHRQRWFMPVMLV
jgi:hypothetical protein